MDTIYRLSLELPNGGKFRAHGSVADVREDAERFYEKLLSIPTTIQTTLKSNVTSAPTADATNDTDGADAGNSGEVVADALSQSLMDRLFAKDRNGTVSLRALPHGDNAEANAMLALVYGAVMVGGDPQVSGSRLMKAAVQSGLQVERIDRSLASAVGPFVTAAGLRKGRKYGLTNPGIRRAEDILRGILN